MKSWGRYEARPLDDPAKGARAVRRNGFTLIEVMVAVAIIGIAMLALLALNRQNLESVLKAQELTQAAALAQALMAQAEIERFPAIGNTRGDFTDLYPGLYNGFRWERSVQAAPVPDVRVVRIRVHYGPNLSRSFDLVEYMHNPDAGQDNQSPPVDLGLPGGAAPPDNQN